MTPLEREDMDREIEHMNRNSTKGFMVEVASILIAFLICIGGLWALKQAFQWLTVR